MMAELAKLRAAGRSKLTEARGKCSASMKQIRDASRERFASVVARARALRDAERERARDDCRAGTLTIQTEERRALDAAIKSVEAERKHQRTLASYERTARAREPKRSRAESKSEADHEVLANFPRELHDVFHKVKRQIKGNARRSRSEAFAEWIEENPAEVDAIRFGIAENELRRTIERGQANVDADKRRRAKLEDAPF